MQDRHRVRAVWGSCQGQTPGCSGPTQTTLPAQAALCDLPCFRRGSRGHLCMRSLGDWVGSDVSVTYFWLDAWSCLLDVEAVLMYHVGNVLGIGSSGGDFSAVGRFRLISRLRVPEMPVEVAGFKSK